MKKIKISLLPFLIVNFLFFPIGAQDSALEIYKEGMMPTDDMDSPSSPALSPKMTQSVPVNAEQKYREAKKPEEGGKTYATDSSKKLPKSPEMAQTVPASAEKEYREAKKPEEGIEAHETVKDVPKPKVEVHGFVKMDVQHMDRIPLGWNSTYPIIPTIPLNEDRPRHHSQTLLDARYTQLWVESTYNYCGWKFKGWIGVEFNSADGNALVANDRHPFLHLSYIKGDYKDRWSFVAGQYFSMFVSEIASPFDYFIADPHGPASQINARQPQVRVGYQTPLPCKKGFFRISLNVEKQSAGHFPDEDDAIGSEQGLGFHYPLFCVKAEWRDWEPLQMEFIIGASENRLIHRNGKDSKTDAWGYKVCFQSKIWKPTLFGTYLYLEGLSRLPMVPYVDIVTTFDGRLRATRAWGGNVGLAIPLYEKDTSKTYLTLMAGWLYAKEIPNSFFSGDVKQKYRTLQAELGHKFWESFVIAGQYKRFDVRAFNGKRGEMNQVSASLYYFF